MKRIILALTAALIACTPSGTTPLKQTWEMMEFETKVVLVREDKIRQTCADLGVPYEANGCGAINYAKKQCTIYVMPQRWQEDAPRLQIIGHEIWHCMYGQWHD